MGRTGAELLVGIDIGTSKTKASVVDARGREIGWAQVPTPWRQVATGAEAAPAEVLEAAVTVLGTVLATAPEGTVAGVGVTSAAESLVLVGADDRPVSPTIAWYDTRTRQESAELAAVFGDDEIAGRTGMGEVPICGLAKLAWHVRQAGAPASRAFSLADWVVFCLGGGAFSEASLASRTAALDLQTRQWWPEALAWAGVGPGFFPEVVPAGHRAGRVDLARLGQGLGTAPAASADLGRLAGAAVSSAGHDHLCAAAGLGALKPEQVLGSCGTAEAFVRAVPPLGRSAVLDAHRAGLNVGWHTVPGTHALLAGHSMGLVLNRVLSLLGMHGREAVAALDDAARAITDPRLRVAEAGLYGDISVLNVGASASPADLWKAALDHTREGAAQVLSAMESIAGPAQQLVLSGGWAHCRGVRQGRRSLLPDLCWPAVAEGGARGAALFSGCAAGLFAGPADWPPPPDRAETAYEVPGPTSFDTGVMDV